MGYADYKNLIVWQKSMALVHEVYHLVEFLPANEKYALSEQMRRAAVSIPSNIAEGEARKSKKEFIQFLSIANGSRAELETQLQICCDMDFFTQEQIKNAMTMCEEISKMIFSLIEKTKSKH